MNNFIIFSLILFSLSLSSFSISFKNVFFFLLFRQQWLDKRSAASMYVIGFPPTPLCLVLLLIREGEKFFFFYFEKGELMREKGCKKTPADYMLWSSIGHFHLLFATIVFTLDQRSAKGRYVWKSLMIWKMYDNLYDVPASVGPDSLLRTVKCSENKRRGSLSGEELCEPREWDSQMFKK